MAHTPISNPNPTSHRPDLPPEFTCKHLQSSRYQGIRQFTDQPLHLEGATDDVDPTFFDTTEEHLKALRRYRQYIEETGESKGFESARAGQSELHKSYTNYIDAVLRLQLDGVKELVLFLTTLAQTHQFLWFLCDSSHKQEAQWLFDRAKEKTSLLPGDHFIRFNTFHALADFQTCVLDKPEEAYKTLAEAMSSIAEGSNIFPLWRNYGHIQPRFPRCDHPG